MSGLIVDQERCDRLANKLWAAGERLSTVGAPDATAAEAAEAWATLGAPPKSGRRRGRVSITRLARLAWAPVTMPRHRKQDTP